MGFRRSKTSALDARAWRIFYLANVELLRSSGVPVLIYESRVRFDNLLMHGYVHDDTNPIRFSVDELSAQQREALIEATAQYLRAGFGDPGISMGVGLTSEVIRRRAESPDSAAEQL